MRAGPTQSVFSTQDTFARERARNFAESLVRLSFACSALMLSARFHLRSIAKPRKKASASCRKSGAKRSKQASSCCFMFPRRTFRSSFALIKQRRGSRRSLRAALVASAMPHLCAKNGFAARARWRTRAIAPSASLARSAACNLVFALNQCSRTVEATNKHYYGCVSWRIESIGGRRARHSARHSAAA